MPYLRTDGLKEDYFLNWSQSMSYILGFTMADGGVVANKQKYCLRYQLCDKDDIILKYIISELYIIDKKIAYRDTLRKNAITKSCILEITSKKIVQSLINYNIIPNKTGKEILPLIPVEYKADYLRGLFDGDGCINWHGKNNKLKNLRRITIASASNSFLKQIQADLCFDYGNISWNGGCYILKIGQKQQIDDIYNLMYYDNHPFSLSRKKEKFKCGL